MVKKSTTVQRTLEALRKQGLFVTVASWWNPFSRTRKDLFGIFDLLAIDPVNRRTIGVQVTTKAAASAHRKKIKESEGFALWQDVGNEIWLISWWQEPNRRWKYRLETPQDWIKK